MQPREDFLGNATDSDAPIVEEEETADDERSKTEEEEVSQ